ncbi:MAG: hypothetical protein ABI910_20410 [Gemmatimonadota bacterium]
MAAPLVQSLEPARRPGRSLRRPLHVAAMVNGPGEVAAWLYPFAHALRQQQPDAVLTAALLPCRFASGREAQVIHGMPDVDHVLRWSESLRWLARGRSPLVRTPPDVILHFGGEIAISIALGRRLGVPVVAYQEEALQRPEWLHRVFVRDARTANGHESDTVRVIGNLMVDAALLRVPHRAASPASRPIVALFPGSRTYFLQQLLPFFLRVAHSLQSGRPDVRFVLAQSPFVSNDDVRRAVAPGGERVVEGDSGTVHVVAGRCYIRSERGVNVEVLTPEAAMQHARLAITIPGTNTAELAVLGIPMLLVLPTNRLHAVPLPGLAGHLGQIPIVGPAAKELIAQAIVRRRSYWAHPNRLANAAIVPEMIGILTADGIAERLARILSQPLAPMEQRLRHAMGAPGASDRLVQEVTAVATEWGRADA